MPQLTPGDTAPSFSLPGADGEAVSLDELLERCERGVVVYFYPKASTPGCTKEANDFRDTLPTWTAAGYTIVGVSPDAPAALRTFTERACLPFALLSDADHGVMDEWGVWGEKTNYGRTYTGVVRSTVVVRKDGTVELAAYNIKATGHVARLLAALGLA